MDGGSAECAITPDHGGAAMRQTIRTTRLAGMLLIPGALLLGCATTPPPAAELAAAEIPALATSDSTRIIAWVPRAQAPIQTAARATLHVALAAARKRTAADLCPGHAPLTGQLTEEVSPLPEPAPAGLGGYPAWRFELAWRTGERPCGTASRAEYLRQISRHAPQWMVIQTPAPHVLFHQGEPLHQTATR